MDMIKRGIPLILTYHLEGKNHLYLNSLHSMGTLHLREWFDSHQGLWYTPVLSPMLPLCRVESLSTFLGSIPFSVIGHSFNLNISEKLFVRNYQKKMRRARVLHLPKWNDGDWQFRILKVQLLSNALNEQELPNLGWRKSNKNPL